jgi:hypothetical protein
MRSLTKVVGRIVTIRSLLLSPLKEEVERHASAARDALEPAVAPAVLER